MSEVSRRPIWGLVGWFLVVGVAAVIGSVASMQAPEFYRALEAPSWAPPASVFGPVWSILYVMMALAAWLVWRAYGWSGARAALTLFLMQLAANALWSWLFFAWRRGSWAFFELVVLWVLIVATIVAFWRLRRVAAALLLPYLAWVTYAGALNYVLWRANPGVLG
jgi:tryptophan-rich sensory protein